MSDEKAFHKMINQMIVLALTGKKAVSEVFDTSTRKTLVVTVEPKGFNKAKEKEVKK